MADIKSFPNNRDEYVGAEHVMRWLHGRTSGVFGAEGNASVAPVLDTMVVTVSDGNGWISNSNADGIVWWIDNESANGSKLQLAVDMADAVLPRIDRVVVSWRTTNYVALPEVIILKGTPASNPVAPALTNNNIQRQISLAAIHIPAGTTAITAAMITDERLDESVCGLVTDHCDIDTSMIQQQVRSLVEEAQAQSKAVIDGIEQELANVIGGEPYDFKPIRVDNVLIPADSFVSYIPAAGEEQKLYDLGFTYRAAVAISGVLGSMLPYVTLSLADVEMCGAGIANQFQTYAGGLYVYADNVPTRSGITALCIECRKAVAV